MSATAVATKTVVTIARDRLRRALSDCLSVCDMGKKAMPVTGHLLLDAGGSRLTIFATNFDTFVRLAVDCEVAGEGRVLLPAKRLLDIVASLPAVSAVTLSFGKAKATIRAGHARFEILGLAPDEFPLFPAIESDGESHVDCGTLLDAMTRCAAHASDAASRPSINAVCLESSPDRGLVVIATNGSSLARLPVGAVVGAPLRTLSVVPSDVALLARIFGAVPGTVALSVDENRLRLASDDIAVQVRLVGQPFPHYVPLLAQSPTHTAVCDRLHLLAAIKRVALATDERGRIEIVLDDALTVRATTSDIGNADDVVQLDRHDRPREASFSIFANATLAVTALDTLTSTSVELSVQSPDRAMLFRAAEHTPSDPTVILVMPLRS